MEIRAWMDTTTGETIAFWAKTQEKCRKCFRKAVSKEFRANWVEVPVEPWMYPDKWKK